MAGEQTAPTTGPGKTQDDSGQSLSLLAKDYFGENFTGEVKPPKPDKTKDDDAADDTNGQRDDADTDDGSDADGAGDAGNQDADDTPAEGDDGDGEAISTVEELIAHQEWDPEWFNSLEVPVKVDGKPAAASMRDLVASYQMNAAADKRLEDAKAKATAQTKELAEKSEQIDQQIVAAAKLMETAEKLLDADESAVDWTALRTEDPAEYSAKKAEFADRRKAIDEAKRETVNAYQSVTDERKAEQTEAMKKRLEKEHELLLEKLPEWRDQPTAKAERTKLSDYLMNQGFTKEDVMGASDHRLILLARKAMLYDDGKSKVAAAKKKVAKVPKVMRPGTPKPQEQAKREKVDKAKSRLQQSGSIDDAMAFLKAKRGG